jgi:hypothetical protein
MIQSSSLRLSLPTTSRPLNDLLDSLLWVSEVSTFAKAYAMEPGRNEPRNPGLFTNFRAEDTRVVKSIFPYMRETARLQLGSIFPSN